MIKEAIEKLMQAENLTYDQVKESVDEIMTGQASPALIASFLTALSIKGETDEEIAGAAESMRSKALPLDSDGAIMHSVGTGGDKSGSFNISTTAGIIAAAAGVRIAKHGNRAASSRSGAADCLEALGVNINASKETMERALREENICFMFAQKYHSAMKYVAPVRRELGIRTIFNVLGPLTNPAHATRMVLGVFNADYVDKIAAALNQLGVTDALVVFGGAAPRQGGALHRKAGGLWPDPLHQGRPGRRHRTGERRNHQEYFAGQVHPCAAHRRRAKRRCGHLCGH